MKVWRRGCVMVGGYEGTKSGLRGGWGNALPLAGVQLDRDDMDRMWSNLSWTAVLTLPPRSRYNWQTGERIIYPNSAISIWQHGQSCCPEVAARTTLLLSPMLWRSQLTLWHVPECLWWPRGNIQCWCPNITHVYLFSLASICLNRIKGNTQRSAMAYTSTENTTIIPSKWRWQFWHRCLSVIRDKNCQDMRYICMKQICN
jgi:hypothetical protein